MSVLVPNKHPPPLNRTERLNTLTEPRGVTDPLKEQPGTAPESTPFVLTTIDAPCQPVEEATIPLYVPAAANVEAGDSYVGS